MPNNTLSDRSLLMTAAIRNDVEFLKTANLCERDTLERDFLWHNTPLLWAVANSSIEFALSYLDLPFSAHIHALSDFENTALILSVAKGWNHTNDDRTSSIAHSLLIKKLLEKGACVDDVDLKGRTALHYAYMHRNLEAIQALEKAGADKSIRDLDGLKPLDCLGLSYKKASQLIKDEATVFTLDINNFYSDPLKISGHTSAKLQQALNFIDGHAKSIFLEYVPLSKWEAFRKAILSELPAGKLKNEDQALAIKKAMALLSLRYQLNQAVMRLLHLKDPTAEKQIASLFNNALNSDLLKQERSLLSKVKVMLFNILSLCCLAIPNLINYKVNKQFFFSHQTRSYLAIKDSWNIVQDELDGQIHASELSNKMNTFSM